MTDRAEHREPSTDHEQQLKELEQLARQATLLKNDAVVVASRLNETHRMGELLGDLAQDGTLNVVMGMLDQAIDDDTRLQQAGLLWSSLKVTVARTNGGFALDDSEALQQILATIDQLPDYWRFHLNNKLPKHPYARAYFLVSLYATLLPRLDELGDRAPRLEGQFRALVKDVRSLLLVEKPLDERLALWHVALVKLAATVLPANSLTKKQVEPLLTDEALKPHQELLIRRIAVTLQPGSEEAEKTALATSDMADVLAVLCGRLLNPEPKVLPGRRKLFEAAADHILQAQAHTVSGGEVDAEVGDPLGRRIPPIAFVLDLPTSILKDRVPALIRAARSQMERLRDELSRLLVLFPESPERELLLPPRLNRLDIFNTVYQCLVVGTAVAERFRDLLSELELGGLKVSTPAQVVAWDDLSDSLGFKRELDYVIELWKTRSKNRPGAILVFGPPGTGKTAIAEAFLRRLNQQLLSLPGAGREHAWRFLQLSPADFARDGADRVIASAEDLFQRLQRLRRCVVLLDEMEEFLRSRGTRETDRDGRLVTTAFLPLLQETVDRREIILIVATNYVGGIDSAITRRGRFDLILPLGPPHKGSRAQIIRKALGGSDTPPSPCKLANTDRTVLDESHLEQVVKYTQGYTYGEVLDFLRELATEVTTSSLGQLELTLWRIRQEKVPLALSGNPGCDWRKFRDEATRFRRVLRPEQEGDLKESDKPEEPTYWIDPELPNR